MIEYFGKKVIQLIVETGEITQLIGASIKALLLRKLHVRNFFEQAARVGFDSLAIVTTTLFFIGMVFAIQISRELLSYGAVNSIGGIIGISLWRELAPTLGAVVFAARVGSSITAELGTMKVTEQVDSLRAMGINYINYLIIPRFWAASFVMPLLVIIADVVGLFGGFLVSKFVYDISATVFFDSAQRLLQLSDIYGGLTKALVFGMIVASISCYKGIKISGGAKGVGEGTTQSVVTSLIAIFIANYILSTIFFR